MSGDPGCRSGGVDVRADPPEKLDTSAGKQGGRGAKKGVVAIGWAAIGQFGSQGINTFVGLAVAVFLMPQEIGVMETAWVLISVMDSLVDFGIGMAVIRRKQVTQQFLNTAFTINLGLSLLAIGLMVACGFVVANLKITDFDSASTASVIWQLSGACLVSALATIPLALLYRDLRYDVVAKINLVGAFIRGAVSLTLAALSFGVVSLVVGFYSGSVVGIVLLLVTAQQRARPGWGADWRELMRFGLGLTAFNLLNRVLARADAFVLAPLIGQVNYGIFALARRLMTQTIEMGGSVMRSVLTPLFSKWQDRPPRLRAIYLRADQVIAGILTPVLIVTALSIDLLAGSLLSTKWSMVGPAALAFLPAAMVLLLLETPPPLMLAKGRSAALFWWGVYRGLITVAAYLTSYSLGLVGSILCLGLFLVLLLPVLLGETMDIISVRISTIIHALTTLLPAAAVAAGMLAIARLLAPFVFANQLATFLICSIMAGSCYVLTARRQKVPAWRAVRKQWSRFMRQRAVRTSL